MRSLYSLLLCAAIFLLGSFLVPSKAVHVQKNIPLELVEDTNTTDEDIAEALVGSWYMSKIRSIITITQENGEYTGRITWMKNPKTKRGKVKLDHRNPDPNKRNNRLDKTQIMWGFKHDGGSAFSGGEIYNPSNGSIYSGRLTLVEKRKILAVRAYIGSPLLGKSIRLKRAK